MSASYTPDFLVHFFLTAFVNTTQKIHELLSIIVKDLSRWGRNYLEAGDFLEQKFPAWGTRFISNDMCGSAKLNGATGGIDIAFRNLAYKLHSHGLSEKVRSAKLTRRNRENILAVTVF